MTKLKGIKIVSDGTVTGTRVFDSEGRNVTGSMHIRSIRWSHNARGIPTAQLTCLLSEIEATVDEAEYDSRWVDVSTHGKDTAEYDDAANIPK